MAYKFRTPGPWGPGQAADLDPVDVDNNFWQAIQDIAAKAAQGVGIANFTVSGNQLTVVLTDHTLLGPYTLPTVTLQFRGEWQPGISYLANDIITHGGATYLVLFNHTSAATFDPGANDGLGHNYYGLLLSNPALTLPAGGVNGAFLRKVGTVDYVSQWTGAALTELSDITITSPIEGEVLTYLHGVWVNAAVSAALANLTDVSIGIGGPLTIGQVLEWDGSFWTNNTPVTELSQLSDITLSSLAAGQVLTWAGGSPAHWTNTTPAFALAALSDVTLTGPVYTGQPLVYDGTVWANRNAADMLMNDLGSIAGTNIIDVRFFEFTRFTIIADTTISFNFPNLPGQFVRRALEVTNNASYALNWPHSIKWPGGVAPTLTPFGLDVFVFYTHDGGTTVFGNTVGQAYSVVP
jgi:hypothetical protein